jgi:hypothetical protein
MPIELCFTNIDELGHIIGWLYMWQFPNLEKITNLGDFVFRHRLSSLVHAYRVMFHKHWWVEAYHRMTIYVTISKFGKNHKTGRVCFSWKNMVCICLCLYNIIDFLCVPLTLPFYFQSPGCYPRLRSSLYHHSVCYFSQFIAHENSFLYNSYRLCTTATGVHFCRGTVLSKTSKFG